MLSPTQELAGFHGAGLDWEILVLDRPGGNFIFVIGLEELVV
jgi:hypothetical protein